LYVPATRANRIPLRYWRIGWKTIGKRSHIWPFAWAAELIGNFKYGSGATCRITHVLKIDRRIALIRLEADWS